jgi:hypothetical protein
VARRVYNIISDRGQVKPGATGARLVSVSALLKTNDKLHHCVANEYLAERIGRFMGVSIPPGAIGKLAEQQGYISLDFTLTGEVLPPVNPSDCYAKLPDMCTGIVMFDILIANSDRHPNNLSATLQDEPYEIMAFDHSHALFGSNESEALKRLTDLRDRLAVSGGSVTKGNRHCLIDQLTDESRFTTWIDRIEKLPDHYIETACDDLFQRDFITADEFSKVKDFLRHRRDQFRKLVKDHQKAFKGIKQFGLTV